MIVLILSPEYSSIKVVPNKQQMFSQDPWQCDHIKRFLKVLGNIFAYKSRPTTLVTFWAISCKKCVATFWAIFREN